LVFVGAMMLTTNLTGQRGFWTLFVIYLLFQICSNTAQAAVQGLIPDLVPEELRGRYSGVKALFEVPLPVILVSFVIAPIIGGGNLALGIAVMGGVLTLSMLITMFVPEAPLEEEPPPLDLEPFQRLLLMTGVFTAIILGMREVIQWIGRLLENVDSVPGQVAGMGLTGLLAMGITIAAGVWACVRISLGRERAQDTPSFTWWVVNRLAFLVSLINLSGFVLYFVQARLGLSETAAAEPAQRVMLFVGISLLLSALPSGWLTDHFGAHRVVMVSGLIAATGTLILLLVPSVTLIYAGGFVVGLAAGAFYAANWALGTALIPQKQAARYLGIANLAGAGSGAVGAYLSGPIADYFTRHVPQSPGLGYILIFALYALLFLASSLVLLKVRAPLQDTAA
jgi:MFS family permease